MVQRKATPKPAPQAEPKRSRAKLESRRSSFQQQQDTRSKGGGHLIKKKLNMERSPPNYMKPTTCSTARSQRLPVKKTTPKDSQVRSFSKSLNRQSSLGGIRSLTRKSSKVVVFNKHTCSSTLKHSKFPMALDLSPGATEAQGTSVVKVCPYSYCSLNGHRRLEPLPSLKRFMSPRRKLLKKQKAPPNEQVHDDFFFEIYTEAPELISESEGDGIDQGSKLSDDATDVVMNFIEHVTCEQQVEVDAWGKMSEDGFGLSTLYNELLSIEKTFFPYEVAESDDASSSDELCRSSSGEDTETEDVLENDIIESDGPGVQKFMVSKIIEDDVNEEADDANSFSITQFISEDCVFQHKSDYTKKEQLKNSVDTEHTKARLRITRKKMIEEPKEEREFNPRGPRFLEPEADPEAEKVDLRHQTMHERKNSEEWMIDYALRRALMKMAPARKRKVALLVEAFETVAPPVWEKPSRHDASGLARARIIQACN